MMLSNVLLTIISDSFALKLSVFDTSLIMSIRVIFLTFTSCMYSWPFDLIITCLIILPYLRIQYILTYKMYIRSFRNNYKVLPILPELLPHNLDMSSAISINEMYYHQDYCKPSDAVN